jgi:hypothetical protein
MKSQDKFLSIIFIAVIVFATISIHSCKKDENITQQVDTEKQYKQWKTFSCDVSHLIGTILTVGEAAEIPCTRISVMGFWDNTNQRYTSVSHITEAFNCSTGEILTVVEFHAESPTITGTDYPNMTDFNLYVDNMLVTPGFSSPKMIVIASENGESVIEFLITYESVMTVWEEIYQQMILIENDNPYSINEQIIVEAHNLMVDFLLKSKEALDQNPEEFEAICAANNMEGLIEFIYSNEAEAMQKSSRFMELVYEIYASLPTDALDALNASAIEESYCSSCALNSFPETLRNLNYALPPNNGSGSNINSETLLLCLAECAIACGSIPACWLSPPLCGGCIAICTAACYGLSSNACIASYSIQDQAYVVGYVVY